MNAIRLVLVVVLVHALGGCAAVATKVGPGETVVGNRMSLQAASPWNQLERNLVVDGTPTWTVDGLGVDTVKFYVGVADGQVIAPSAPGLKSAPLTFRASMQPAEIVQLVQTLVTRDGSSFVLEKLEPIEFVGARGFRFEYAMVRKLDEVRMRGVGYGAVRNGELWLINFAAPRLTFYPRLAGPVDALARSARVKS